MSACSEAVVSPAKARLAVADGTTRTPLAPSCVLMQPARLVRLLLPVLVWQALITEVSVPVLTPPTAAARHLQYIYLLIASVGCRTTMEEYL